MSDVAERVKKIVVEHLGVEIPDDAAEKILTVKDAIGYIEENSAA